MGRCGICELSEPPPPLLLEVDDSELILDEELGVAIPYFVIFVFYDSESALIPWEIMWEIVILSHTFISDAHTNKYTISDSR